MRNLDTAPQPQELDGEEGSALVIALVMITVMALLVAVVLDFAGTTATTTPAVVTQRDNLHEVDGAVEAAINSIRGSQGLGSQNFSQSCDSGNVFDADSGDSYNITVKCYPQAGSGSTADDVPPYAVLLLGSDGLNQTGNALLTIDGGLYSHGIVTQQGSGSSAQRELEVYGDLWAHDGCAGVSSTSIRSVGGIACTGGSDPSGNDPAYPPFKSSSQVDSELAALTMAVDPTATCPDGGFARFSPGLYTEVPVAPSSCSEVWWFQPGFYYFDFPDAASAWQLNASNKKYILGGTRASGLTTTTPYGTVSTTWRGKACDQNASGVQFVFGGASRLSVESGGFVELCGSTDATNHLNQRIAFYGLNTGTRSTTTDQSRAVNQTPTSPLVGGWSTPAFAATSETPLPLYATATVAGNQTSDLTIPGFADVPLGSTITGLKLRVRRFATNDKARSKVLVTLPVTSSRTSTVTKTYDLRTDCVTTVCVDDVTIPLSDLGSSFAYQDVNGMSAVIRAAVQGGPSSSVTENVDSVELLVSYTNPGYEAARCPASSPGCAVLKTTVSQSIFFHGTVYTPASKLDLWVNNNDTTIFDRGLIADSLVVDFSASSKQTTSPFRLPSATTGRKVLFVGQVNGVDRVRALVAFQDYNVVNGQKLAFPGYRVTVEKWSVVR